MRHLALNALFLVTLTAHAGDAGPRVFFIEPKDGATVAKKFKVKMGVEGMTVRPSGPIQEGTGHHHILIDRLAIEKGEVVPVAKTAIHYGKGETETELTLPAGKHKLTLQFADGMHHSYGPELSATITVNVK